MARVLPLANQHLPPQNWVERRFFPINCALLQGLTCQLVSTDFDFHPLRASVRGNWIQVPPAGGRPAGGNIAEVPGVALNWLRKCIGLPPSMSLKRQSLLPILRSVGLEPADHGIDPSTPPREETGGYAIPDFQYLAGRYFHLRRSFPTSMNVRRSVLDLAWGDRDACLLFEARLQYLSDHGVPQDVRSSGKVRLHRDRILMSLPAVAEGEVRLALLHTPSRPVAGETNLSLRARGVLLTHGFPRGFFQPVVPPSPSNASQQVAQNRSRRCAVR
jgi:hypothetical protein